MSDELIRQASASSVKTDVPAFDVGDTVRVQNRIVEGDKERLQAFIGTVIARRGSGLSETFTVRRIVNNEGVERVFPVHSPRIADVEIVRRGKTRRAKLYYLRDRVGKATRLKEIRPPSKAERQAAEKARLAQEEQARREAEQDAQATEPQAEGQTDA